MDAKLEATREQAPRKTPMTKMTKSLTNQIPDGPDGYPQSALGWVAAVQVLAGVLVYLLLFIVPVFARVYQQFHVDLSMGTRVVLLCSNVLRENGPILLSAVFLLSAASAAACCFSEGRAVLNGVVFLLGRWLSARMLAALATVLLLGTVYLLYLPIWNLGIVIR
jgi:hypothetical protein